MAGQGREDHRHLRHFQGRTTVIKEAEADWPTNASCSSPCSKPCPTHLFQGPRFRFVRVSKSKAAMTLELVQNRLVTDHPRNSRNPCQPISRARRVRHPSHRQDRFRHLRRILRPEAFQEEHEILRTGNPVIGKIERETYPGKCMLVTKMPWRDRDGNIIGTFGVPATSPPSRRPKPSWRPFTSD